MSGVYIPGFEMPKNCRFCKLAQTDDGYVCSITGDAYSWGLDGPPSDCPLIPVPGHGRLIDGDELAAGCDDPYWCRWLSEIEDAPTIIPANHFADIGNMADKEDE